MSTLTLTAPTTSPNRRRAKIALVGAVVVGALLAHRFGLLGQLEDPARLKQTLVDLGPWGFVAFVLAYAFIQPFGVPGTWFVVAASLVWPWPTAFALSTVGTMAATSIGFSFARFVARDSVARVIPKRFEKYNDSLEQRAFTTVFFLRAVFWMHPLLHAFFGVSKVRFWTHFWASLAGYVLPLFLFSYFGDKVLQALKDAPPSVWVAVGIGAVVLIGVGVWIKRRRRQDDEGGASRSS